MRRAGSAGFAPGPPGVESRIEGRKLRGMDAIKRLGAFVGSHMPFIVPVCVAIGVLFPGQLATIKGLVPVLFAVITFQGSLNTTMHQVSDTFRHPKALLAILACSAVVMPVLARVVGGIFFADDEIVTGVVIEYCIPVAVVSFMWIGIFSGNASLGLAAILISTVLAPFTVPLTLHVLMGASVVVDAASMVRDLLFMVAIPAMVGVAVNELTHGWGHERLSPVLSPICRLLLLVIITCNSTGLSPYILSGDIVVLQVAVLIFFLACFGFLLGFAVARILRVPMADLFSMCFCVGLRNISSGAVIAAEFFPGSAIIPVMIGTLFQQVLASLCGTIMQRLAERAGGAEHGAEPADELARERERADRG